jgi:hypothetical protein
LIKEFQTKGRSTFFKLSKGKATIKGFNNELNINNINNNNQHNEFDIILNNANNNQEEEQKLNDCSNIEMTDDINRVHNCILLLEYK